MYTQTDIKMLALIDCKTYKKKFNLRREKYRTRARYYVVAALSGMRYP